MAPIHDVETFRAAIAPGTTYWTLSTNHDEPEDMVELTLVRYAPPVKDKHKHKAKYLHRDTEITVRHPRFKHGWWHFRGKKERRFIDDQVHRYHGVYTDKTEAQAEFNRRMADLHSSPERMAALQHARLEAERLHGQWKTIGREA